MDRLFFLAQGPTVPLPEPPRAPAGVDFGKITAAVQAWTDHAIKFLRDLSSPLALLCVVVGGILFLIGLSKIFRGLARIGLGIALAGVGVWLFVRYAPLLFAVLGGR